MRFLLRTAALALVWYFGVWCGIRAQKRLDRQVVAAEQAEAEPLRNGLFGDEPAAAYVVPVHRGGSA